MSAEILHITDDSGGALLYYGDVFIAHLNKEQADAFRTSRKNYVNRPCPCPVAVQVANKILDRADHGFKKYGATLDRGDLTLRDWANHLQEELMDATDYLQVIINKMDQLEGELKK